jgi:hypothetical protein
LFGYRAKVSRQPLQKGGIVSMWHGGGAGWEHLPTPTRPGWLTFRAPRGSGGLAQHAFKPLVRGMAKNLNALRTSPEQYLERAKIIRRQVETMSNAGVCRQLLDIADRYEELADGIERPRRGGDRA